MSFNAVKYHQIVLILKYNLLFVFQVLLILQDSKNKTVINFSENHIECEKY